MHWIYLWIFSHARIPQSKLQVELSERTYKKDLQNLKHNGKKVYIFYLILIGILSSLILSVKNWGGGGGGGGGGRGGGGGGWGFT